MRWIFVALALLLASCDSGPEPLPDGSPKERVKALSDRIIDVTDYAPDTMVITWFEPSIYDGASWISDFFKDSKKILSRFSEAAKSQGYTRVSFIVQIPTKDNLGHSAKDTGMKVTFNPQDLKTANWEGMSGFDMTSLPSEIVFRRFGLEAGVEYCKDKDRADLSRDFCSQVVANLLPR